jgi:hypothetical protein
VEAVHGILSRERRFPEISMGTEPGVVDQEIQTFRLANSRGDCVDATVGRQICHKNVAAGPGLNFREFGVAARDENEVISSLS